MAESKALQKANNKLHAYESIVHGLKDLAVAAGKSSEVASLMAQLEAAQKEHKEHIDEKEEHKD